MGRCRIPFLKPPQVLTILFLILPTQKLSASDFAPFDSNGSGGRGRGGSLVFQHNEIKVGAVLDLGSWIGKSIQVCIQMAISDFYASKPHYRTRLVLHTRDSRGESPSRHAISSAIDLLENVKVQALMLGPETVLETKSLGELGKKAGVPMFSFPSIISGSGPGEYPFLVQIKQDETLQFRAIAEILSWHQWRTVSVIYEDTDDGRDSIPYLIRSLQERNIRVSHRKAISPFSTDDQMLDQLHELAILLQRIFIVHLSPSRTYSLFLTAEKLGMMKEGHVWIVTDKTMNRFQSMDSEVVESMQGVVGLKAYISSSKKLRDFNLRWKMEFYRKNPSAEFREIDVLGIWAYDTIWALSESIETLGQEHMIKATGGNFYSGKELLDAVAQRRISGLSGEFQIVDGRLNSETFEIVNVIGKGERSVGLWTQKHGIVKKGRSLSSSISVGLDNAIVWPGITTTAPRGLLMLTSGKKLRIAVLNNAGFKEFISVQHHSDNTTIITGFCADVFHASINSLNYSVPFELVPYVTENGTNLGSYSDLVNQVYLQNFDGILGDVTITSNRSLYVDFTVTYTDLGVGAITKRANTDIWLIWRPLHPYLWATIFVSLVLIGLMVWFIERSNPEFEGIGTALWFGFATFFFAHREKLTSNSSRFIVIVWLFAVLILTTTYTAGLSSILTVRKIQQLTTEGAFIGTHRNSFIGASSNLNFADDRLQLYSSPEEYAGALSEGRIKAIIDEVPYLKVFMAKYGANDYAIVASKPTTNGFGFAFHKKYGQLVFDLSQAIMKLREDGELATMEKTWVTSWAPFVPENADSTPNILNLHTFGGLFLICSSCCAVVLVHLISLIRANWDRLMNIMAAVRERMTLIFRNLSEQIAAIAGQMFRLG